MSPVPPANHLLQFLLRAHRHADSSTAHLLMNVKGTVGRGK